MKQSGAKTQPLLRATVGREGLAFVYMLQLDDDPRHLVETVDSIDPRYPRADKAVIIISTQFGCPVGCLMCDAGGQFEGNLTAEQMLAQVRFVSARRPENLASRKLKVHFARMGEPALNPAVLEALEQLPTELPTPHLLPCISTVAPRGSQAFFAELQRIKKRRYDGHFQLQFSINTTDETLRRRLIPTPHLELGAIAELAGAFCKRPDDRKVVLNFALGCDFPVDVDLLARRFDSARFMVKLTPINPTEQAQRSGLTTILSAADPASADALAGRLRQRGFDTVVSIGESEETDIGSNCGQFVRARLETLGQSASDEPIQLSKIWGPSHLDLPSGEKGPTALDPRA
jgi:23S rRNA (adenine2503-C2)-methyltransferase